jgi:hypothetical protein
MMTPNSVQIFSAAADGQSEQDSNQEASEVMLEASPLTQDSNV